MNFDQTEQQRALVAATRKFAEREIAPLAARWDEEEHIPRDHIQKLADAGFFGLTFPEKYGGRERATLDAILVVEEVARHCSISARLIVDHNFGAVDTILNFGTEEQRRRVLPAVVSGEKLISIGMTEPDAGSALVDLKTAAMQEGDWIRINGHKRWITGAGEREYTLVYARFEEISGSEGIGAVLVEMGTPGFQIGRRIPTLGVRGLREGELIFQDALVPKNILVVPPGTGFRLLMSAYNGQRLAASAVALGIAQGAFDYALAYADRREQFGQRITDFQAIQFKIADMIIDLEAARYLVYRAASSAVGAISDRMETSLAKTYTSEMAIRVTGAALQMMGGEGYSREHPIERMCRDARMFTLAGGSTEMQRLAIASHVLGRRLPQHRDTLNSAELGMVEHSDEGG